MLKKQTTCSRPQQDLPLSAAAGIIKDDILLQQTTPEYRIGFWKNGTTRWQGGDVVHTGDWQLLGCYDMDGDGQSDLAAVGRIEESAGKIVLYAGYYRRGIDHEKNWVTLGSLTTSADADWQSAIGNLTGKKNSNSFVWHSAKYGKLGAWLDGSTQWTEIPGDFGKLWHLAGCGDFDGTGKESVLMSYDGGAVYYTVDLTGTLKELKGMGPEWQICGIGDLDGKGKDDILFVHQKIGNLAKWSLGKPTILGPLDTSVWQVLGCGRYSGGNGADVLVQNHVTGLVGYYAGGKMSEWHEIGILDKGWKIIPGSCHGKTGASASGMMDCPNEFFPLQSISKNLSVALMLLRNDIKAKFRHSVLGFLWLFIPPLLILLIYVYMFSFIFKMRWPEAGFSSRWGMGLFIYTGITVYSSFSDTLMGSLNLLPAHSGMVKKVPFPLELFPVSLAASNILISGAILWIIFSLSLITGGQGSWTAFLYFPVIYLPYALLICGLCWITSTLGVFFRDLGNLMGVILLLCFFASPVLYSEKMIPEQIGWILRINPLGAVIRNIRCIFLQNTPPDVFGILYTWIVGIVLFQAGFFFFQRQRRRFSDVI